MASFGGELRRRNVYKVAVAYAIVAWLLSACATAPYQPAELDSIAFRDRAQTPTKGRVTVSAAVPGPGPALCANVVETPTPPEITVEGESGIHVDEQENHYRRNGSSCPSPCARSGSESPS